MNRLATVLLCTFLLASVASAVPAPTQPVPASPDQPLLLLDTLCTAPADASTFSPATNYCGDCALNSHCTPLCGGPGICQPASWNPKCGVCICA